MIAHALAAAAALAAVLAMVWGLHALGRARLRPRGAKRLALEETIALDSRRRLLLVRCDQRHLLIQTGSAQDLIIGWLPEDP